MASLRYVLRKFLRFSKDFLAARARLSPEQYEALLALKAFSAGSGLTVGQLSERVQVKHHTAVSLTDKLAARKLVTKRQGSPDRRRVYVKLTPAGARLVEISGGQPSSGTQETRTRNHQGAGKTQQVVCRLDHNLRG